MNPCYYQEAPFELVKRTVKFIIWFSVLTFFLSNPSWVSLFLNSFISHVLSFPSLILTHINNKNCIFLLCNGILVILVKSSRKHVNANSVTCPMDNEMPPKVEKDEEMKTLVVGNHGLMAETEQKMEGNDMHVIEERENEENNSNEFCIAVEKDVEEDESIAKLSTEELNRRFDEFIRRMKKEIRFEAQQQLIMV